MIVDASRNFVCMRLATYEDKDEAKILTKIFSGRSGQLENTVFTMTDPQATKSLVRSGRSPDFAFSGAINFRIASMAKTMNDIARQYPVKHNVDIADAELPYVANLRLATNITACDNLPLIIVAGDKEQQAEIEKVLKPIAWSDKWIGQFSYVLVSDADELASVEYGKQQAGLVFVQPDKFGTKARVIGQLSMKAITPEKIESAMKVTKESFTEYEKDTRQYHLDGSRNDIHWETAIPVTDPHSNGGGPPSRGPSR